MPPAFFARRLEKHEDRVFSALGGALCFQLLRTAYDVGLFKLLHTRPGLCRDEIAHALGLQAYSTEILLLGLVPMKLVERIADRYYNNPILSGLLSGELHDGGLGKIIEYFHRVINPAMLHLEEAVVRGEPVGLHRLFGRDTKSFYDALGRHDEYNGYFQAAMRADTQLNRDRVAASAVFAGHRRLLDVGGSSGELAIAIAAHHPTIHVTVLDFPEVAARATARFHAEGLSDRLDAIGGDLLEEGFSPGYDCILFAHVLDIFSPEKVQRLLESAYDCLPEGGAICVFGSAMNDDETGPLMYGVLSSYFLCLADGEGRFYTAKQTAGTLRDIGLVDVHKMLLPRHEVMLWGVKRRASASHRAPRARAPDGAARLSKVSALFRLGRPKFLIYSLLLYALGSAAVVHDGHTIDFSQWTHGLVFVWCAHLMTHYCNDYFDLAADSANPAPTGWTGGSRILVEGHLRPIVSLAVAFVLLFVALALALSMPGAGTRWLSFVMLALAWFYSAPPLRLNYHRLGEITVATVLNLAVPLLAYGLQSHHISVSAPLLGIILPTFIMQTARMLVMNLSDYEGDKLIGKRTLAVALGPRRATYAIALGQFVGYGSILLLMAWKVLPTLVGAAMLLTLPISAWNVQRLLRGALRDPALANSVVFWASTHVALVAAAATLGLLAATKVPAPPAALGASLVLCTVILVVFCALLVPQILRNRAAGACSARRRPEEGIR
jgi:1,4-dihydroxy-2-naphthoate octaprenyltransferase